jgi:cytochrome P450
MSLAEASVSVPAHVPQDLVVDIDVWRRPELNAAGLHAQLLNFHQKYPDIFYTPRNGGHWVVTRQALMAVALNDNDHYSTSVGMIPRPPIPIPLIPLTLDPPAHTPFRVVLMRFFGAKKVNSMENSIRELARKLVEEIADRKECEFVRSIGAAVPVTVFMLMMGMPLERFDEFRSLVVEYFSPVSDERRVELHGRIENEMVALIEQRRQKRGDDLISQLLEEKIEGRGLTDYELKSICVLLFQAGMDTVANASAFLFEFLAQHPEIQAELAAHPEKISDCVEEGLRMFGVANTPRVVTQDTELGSANLKKEDMVLFMLPLAGLDDRVIDSPMKFDLSRSRRPHMMFSGGPHICAGQFLARIEMRAMLEEWTKRIPKYSLRPGFVPQPKFWHIIGMSKLQLIWK